MKLRKMVCGLLTASAFGLLLSGCSSAQESQTFAWPLATASPEDTVTQLFAEKFAQETERLSHGSMKIEVYPNSTLGGDRDLLESCADGDIPFVVQNTAPQVTFMQDLAVFDLPAVFDTLEEVRDKVDDPSFRSLISQVYTDGGYHLLGMADQGFRVLSTNRPVQSLSDFASQKIRTMENPYHLAFWKQLSASPTPMSFAEVYIGLQQHTIDAQENPYEVIVSNRLYEQQDYVVETNHLPHLVTLIVSDAFFTSLIPGSRIFWNRRLPRPQSMPENSLICASLRKFRSSKSPAPRSQNWMKRPVRPSAVPVNLSTGRSSRPSLRPSMKPTLPDSDSCSPPASLPVLCSKAEALRTMKQNTQFLTKYPV